MDSPIVRSNEITVAAGCDFRKYVTLPAPPVDCLVQAFLRTRTQHRGTRTHARSIRVSFTEYEYDENSKSTEILTGCEENCTPEMTRKAWH